MNERRYTVDCCRKRQDAVKNRAHCGFILSVCGCEDSAEPRFLAAAQGVIV
jgi:hypothetical protein